MGSRRHCSDPCCSCSDGGAIVTVIDSRPLGAAVGNLSEGMRRFLALAKHWADEAGVQGPIVLSSCRTREQQEEMQRAWDRGDKGGLSYRPSSDSRHIPDSFGYCHAIDLGNDSEWLKIIGREVVQRVPQITWGGVWIPPDIRHFEEKG